MTGFPFLLCVSLLKIPKATEYDLTLSRTWALLIQRHKTQVEHE